MSKRNGSGVIRVLVVAAASVRRAGLEAFVKQAAGLQLVAGVASLGSIATQAQDLHADILLADLDRSDHALLAVLASEDGPTMAAVVLIDDPNLAWSVRALRSGVKAIVPRDASCWEFVAAIEAAYAGFITLAPDVADGFVRNVHAAETEPFSEMTEHLTQREIEVLRMLGRGLSNKEMAARLGISDHTVKFHISSILGKLEVSSRTEAVTQGIRMGVIVI
jgi:DNA-binding NarL/FixJ family response regulator